MAIVDKDSIFFGLRGKIGNMVFKTRKGKTIASSAPKRRANKKSSPVQQKQRSRFAANAQYARTAILDPVLKELYAAAAEENQTASNVAFSDAAHGPQILGIYVDRNRRKVKTVICIEAMDNFRVAKVTVSILTAEGELIEQGDASFNHDSVHTWNYFAALPLSQLEGCIIRATAFDLPGNESESQIKV